jgi:hypothetical protein
MSEWEADSSAALLNASSIMPVTLVELIIVKKVCIWSVCKICVTCLSCLSLNNTFLQLLYHELVCCTLTHKLDLSVSDPFMETHLHVKTGTACERNCREYIYVTQHIRLGFVKFARSVITCMKLIPSI